MNKLDWQYQTHLRARYIFEQLGAALESAPNEQERDEFLKSADNYYLQKLNELYTDEFQLAVLMDRSDILFHAEGEAASHVSPELSAITWLTNVAQSSFKKITQSYLSKHMDKKDYQAASKNLNFRFNGYAPGSIYLGFSVEPLQDGFDLFVGEQSSIDSIRTIIKSLSDIPKYIVNGVVDKRAMLELIDDPAMRDTALQVSYNLSPNGKNGIDELSVANAERHSGTFTQITKRQFKEAIRDPLSNKKVSGEFTGEIREIDLDKERFELRGVKGIGTIRCIKPKTMDAKSIIGQYCRVIGEYETDKEGRPSLMRVDEIEIKTPEQYKL
jgi:hypothetical protein